MKEYVAMLLCVCSVCGIVEVLAPDSNGLKKYVKLISSLCVLAVIAMPAGEILASFGEGEIGLFEFVEKGEREEEYMEVFLNSVNSHNSEYLSLELTKMAEKEFGLREGGIAVEVLLGRVGDSACVEKSVVKIFPSAISEDPRKIAEYIEKITNCKCEIIYCTNDEK